MHWFGHRESRTKRLASHVGYATALPFFVGCEAVLGGLRVATAIQQTRDIPRQGMHVLHPCAKLSRC